MCLMGSNLIKGMGINLHNLLQTSDSMTAANDELSKLEGTAILDLTMGNATICQLVYVTP